MFRVVLIRVAALTAALTLSQPVCANDTEAAIGLGGLVFTKSENIEMLSEELFVSTHQIVVKYRFRNNANLDVSTLVAFPLPEIKYDPDNEFGFRADLDVQAFTTTVDGSVVKPNVEQKALLGGKDETKTLQRYGIALNPYAAYEALSRETESREAELRRIDLLDTHGNPTWSLKKSFYWQQRFPADRDVIVVHRYEPLVGGTVCTALGTSAEPNQHAEYDKFCVDTQLVRAVKSRTKAGSVTEYCNASFSETWIDYVLTTGANWSGPIREFQLVVDKGDADNLVSFCGENVHKIAPAQFEFTASNFVPKQDIHILILEPQHFTDTDAQVGSVATLSCEELWFRRNSIFKTAGYCFKTRSAISTFGNAGCSFDDIDQVPLSSSDRIVVNQIRSIEQSKRCAR